MITDVNLTHATSRSLVSRPLKRGRACMNCRFLKIKCDGQKPICGPCRKHPKDDECEYSDGPARSRTKALEDTVQRLEARLRELEHPEDSTPSVMLYDPYQQPGPPPQLSVSPSYPSSSRSLPNTPYHQLPRLLSPSSSSPESQGYIPLSPFSPPSTTATSPPSQLSISYPSSSRFLPKTPYHQLPRVISPSTSSPESQGYTPLSPFSHPSTTATTLPFGMQKSSPLGIFDSRVIATPDSTSSSLESDQTVCDTLLQAFRPHASEFGFFLDWNRFLQSSTHSIFPDAPMRTSSALLYAIYMWGAHLSSDRQRELHYKHKALQSAAAELTPGSFLHTLQAEVLLSHYFFRTGHFLEARAHTATAVALALGGGLHQIRSLSQPAAPVIEIREDREGVHFRAPADALEEGEQINGFWAVFMLQKNLSVALEPAARVCGVFEGCSMQIDTPWPLEIEDYIKGLSRSDIHGSIVSNFLQASGAPSHQESWSASITAMNVKASILLHQAVYIHGQWRPDIPEQEAPSWWTAFRVVDQLVSSLRSDVAQLQDRPARKLLLTHSLLNAATIKLHSIFYTDPTSRQNCLAAARDMFCFWGTNPQELGYLNPMMGTLWMTACRVFIDELGRIRAASLWPLQAASEVEREQEMLSTLKYGIAVLDAFASENLLIRNQLTVVQEALRAV
ncbi:hypothetical protein B0H19DRAFT_1245914 [Mycena capillaripes]|nr:hypothetical protein B0H19DRAFT_1245914 [Mycena capillaripes]